MRWMMKLAAAEPSPATWSPARSTTASGFRPDKAATALPMSWGPFTSITSTLKSAAAEVRAERDFLLPFASQTTARLFTWGQAFFMAFDQGVIIPRRERH